MSHSPTPPAGGPGVPAADMLSRIQALLSSVAVPKSKTAKTVSVPLATFKSLLDVTTAALQSARLDSPFATLCTKIDSLAAQVAESQKKALSYAQVAASKSAIDSKLSTPPSSTPSSTAIHEPHPPRYDFILRQLDYKHPALAQDTPADIQRTINDILARTTLSTIPNGPPLRVRAVAKLRNGNIRIMWHNQDERDTARTNDEEWLPELSRKLEVFYSSYRVVVHGVPTTFNLDNDACRKEAAKTVVRENSYLGEEQWAVDVLDDVRWMSRHSDHRSHKSHSSMILFFSEPELANLAIKNGIAIEGRLLRAERFRSLPTQCYNCHRFGHIAHYCKSSSTCGLCAGAHATSACSCPSENACTDAAQCKHTQPKCALCKGPHRATSRDCPVCAEIFTRCLSGHHQFGQLYLVPDSSDSSS
uniref:Probable 3-oxoacyl-[acyl-carrier-protein] reductase oxidoreductase (EC) n=1 Tax=Ganoderma boninense TaxID=34458 RepID=A0A5K1K5Y1_9APHY|nr:Probable 3-oxoacyl-[acyl-carrier-protein] reductase oxidoreductase (EC [Ganoderma boninense]